jgi:hypothetical protein
MGRRPGPSDKLDRFDPGRLGKAQTVHSTPQLLDGPGVAVSLLGEHLNDPGEALRE